MLAAILPIALLFVLGCCVGSFINVVAYRLPLVDAPTSSGGDWNLAWPPSQCPQCQTPIPPWHNIPMLSYLMLGGRSACCQQPIGRHYFVVEGLCAVMTALIGLVLMADPWQHTQPALLLNASSLIPLIWGLALHWCLLTLAAMLLRHPQHTLVVWQCLLWLGLLSNLSGAFRALAEAVVAVALCYALGFVLAALVNRFLHKGPSDRLAFFADPLLQATAAALAWFGSAIGWLPIVYVAATLATVATKHVAPQSRAIKKSSALPLGVRRNISGVSQGIVIALLSALWWLNGEPLPLW